MAERDWVKRITINGDQVTENDVVVGAEAAIKIKKMWKEQQNIDLSIWGGLSDEELIKFIQKGKL